MNGSWVRIPLALPAFLGVREETRAFKHKIQHSPLTPTPTEIAQRDQVIESVLNYVRTDKRINLPAFNPEISRPSDQFALQSVGLEPNEFGGTVGEFRFQFEGEEDLLHLIVTKKDGQPLTPIEAQTVAAFLLPDLPQSLMWMKPGEFTQHFYFGHDELLKIIS